MKNLLIKNISLMIPIIFLTQCGFPVLKTTKEIFSQKTIIVYPVHVLKVTGQDEFDTLVAKNIVTYLKEQGLNAEFRNSTPSLNSQWYHNEAKMFQGSCTKFNDFIQKDMQKGDYGLMVELLWLPYEMDLHYALIDKNQKKAVFLGLLNSHHPFHKEIKPQNNEGGFKLFCRSFSARMEELKKQ